RHARPPRSTLFPYTTLFRSHPRTLKSDSVTTNVVRNRPIPRIRNTRNETGAPVFASKTVAITSVDGVIRRCGVRSRFLPGLYLRSEEHTSELQSRSDLVCRL